MNFTLTREQFRSDGIFSTLSSTDTLTVFRTLEHAYPVPEANGDEAFLPKIPSGEYRCVKGTHRLAGMMEDFTTFEITGVPGHSNLLFHVGNFNKDSEGCILVGDQQYESYEGEMITNSKAAFAEFMSLLGNQTWFTLTVVGG